MLKDIMAPFQLIIVDSVQSIFTKQKALARPVRWMRTEYIILRHAVDCYMQMHKC